MNQPRWTYEGGNYTVCVDSYEGSVLKGRILSPHWEAEPFSSLSQFLIKMEQMLDHTQTPQAFTETRRFSSLLKPDNPTLTEQSRKGKKVTFDLKVIFRQHTSWQGILIWKEKQMEHNFRSVLELITLMDSALRSVERGAGP